jgi:hypothetical protein
MPVVYSAQGVKSTNDLSILDWLSGTWEYKSEQNITIEKWEKQSTKTIEGFTTVRKIDAEEPGFSESLRILSMKGDVFYLAKVDQNEMPVPFKLVSAEGAGYVFENRQHDFPQRITYFKQNADSMIVRVEGLTEPNIRYFELYYKRID